MEGIAQAKLQITSDGDYAHLISTLMRSGRMLKMTSQEDFVIDTADHTLFNNGYGLTARKARIIQDNSTTIARVHAPTTLPEPTIDPPSSTTSDEPVVTVLLTQVDLASDTGPVLKFRQLEQPTALDRISEIISGATREITEPNCDLARELVQRFKSLKVKVIGSINSVRQTFVLADGKTMVDVDRCTFYPQRSLKYFVMFECTDLVIDACLNLLQTNGISYTIPLHPAHSMFFENIPTPSPVTSEQMNFNPAQSATMPSVYSSSNIQPLPLMSQSNVFDSQSLLESPLTQFQYSEIISTPGMNTHPFSNAVSPVNGPIPSINLLRLTQSMASPSTTLTTIQPHNNNNEASSGNISHQSSPTSLRRAKNAESTRRYRERKSGEMRGLQGTIDMLTEKVHGLEADKKVLQAQVALLRDELDVRRRGKGIGGGGGARGAR